jgi:hypothetical protein
VTSPLLTRLRSEQEAAADPAERALISARIACYLARVGEFAEADRLRLELRREFGRGEHAQIAILIMCLEGLLRYYRNLEPTARDWMLRANLIAVACHEEQLVALTSAWMAHIDFNGGNYVSMAKSLSASLSHLKADDGSAECRLALVLGDAYLFAGKDQNSRDWYESARLAANRLGDHAAIGALTYNRAALKVANARLAEFELNAPRLDLAKVSAEVRSATNYQAVAQLRSLEHLLDSAAVGVHVLEGRHSEASSKILGLLASEEVPTGSAELALLYADNAYCLAKLGQLELASKMVEAATGFDTASMDADDRATICGQLFKYFQAVDDAESAVIYRDTAEQAYQQHKATITELVGILELFSQGPVALGLHGAGSRK